jgi:hypothetical protein
MENNQSRDSEQHRGYTKASLREKTIQNNPKQSRQNNPDKTIQNNPDKTIQTKQSHHRGPW